MPQNNERTIQQLSKYDAMSSEELVQLLRADSEAHEGNELDIDVLLYITELLAQREKSNYTGKTARDAWAAFQQNYMPVEEVPAKTKKPVSNHPWVRRAMTAAAVVALVVLVPLTAKALNWEKIWNTVAVWTKGTFSFVQENQPSLEKIDEEDTRPFDSLQQAMEQADDEFNMLPTWLPDGFVLQSVDIHDRPEGRSYIALCTNDERDLNISVYKYMETDPVRWEIGNELIEIYQSNGTDFYIFPNNDWLCAIWMQGSHECSISGEITIEELKKMIDSIPDA